jgi:hypothetical protein
VIGPELRAAVAATSWAARERHLSRACSAVAARHNELGLTAPLDPRSRPYFDRPYRVISAARRAGDRRRVDVTAGLLDLVTPDRFRGRSGRDGALS